jgi:hypothetical protein
MDLVCLTAPASYLRFAAATLRENKMRVRLLGRSRSAPPRPKLPHITANKWRAAQGSYKFRARLLPVLVPETLREREGLLHKQGSRARQRSMKIEVQKAMSQNRPI